MVSGASRTGEVGDEERAADAAARDGLFRGCGSGDLIVVGKHGRSPAEEILVGSVTSHVLEYAEADVLVASAAADAAQA